MTQDEFRNLQHGDKINGPDGLNFIVHNNYRSSSGMVIVVRTDVIFGRDCHKWHIVKKKPQAMVNFGPGTYQVTIDKQIY